MAPPLILTVRTTETHRTVLLSDSTSFTFPTYIHKGGSLPTESILLSEDYRRHLQVLRDRARLLCETMEWPWPQTVRAVILAAIAAQTAPESTP